MAPKGKSTHSTGKTPDLGKSVKGDLQITAYQDGYLIKGDITLNHAGLKDFATWDEQRGEWTITRRRAYEYDHHYGLSLFSQ